MALEHEFLIFQLSENKEILELQEEYKSGKENVRYNRVTMSNIAWPTHISSRVEERMSFIQNYYKSNRHNAIRIHDDYILPNLDKFEDVETLLNGFIPFVGLNYYGFTIIPHQSLAVFVDVLKSICVDMEFLPLILLCEEASNKKNSVLHCGI